MKYSKVPLFAPGANGRPKQSLEQILVSPKAQKSRSEPENEFYAIQTKIRKFDVVSAEKREAATITANWINSKMTTNEENSLKSIQILKKEVEDFKSK